MSEEEKEGGFKVVDKRRFTTEGEVREDVSIEDGPSASEKAQKAEKVEAAVSDAPTSDASVSDAPGKEETPQAQATPGAEHPSMDFSAFVAGLATNALAALGVLTPEQTGGMPQDMTLAREYIDILGMLQTKTKGNLSAEEDALMTRILSDLRMAYVQKNS
ncbi:DUF1844 domain-containing protein [Myxococcota bacterium]|nr:DUF1844 domain-containing protein [Myxococcota bacterium]